MNDIEIIEKERLQPLCEEYGFTIEAIGNLVKIKSKFDIWYIPNLEYTKGSNIKLRHANTRGKAGYHYQNSYKNYKEVFAFIERHDHKDTRSYNNMFRIKELLEVIKK